MEAQPRTDRTRATVLPARLSPSRLKTLGIGYPAHRKRALRDRGGRIQAPGGDWQRCVQQGPVEVGILGLKVKKVVSPSDTKQPSDTAPRYEGKKVRR